MSKELVDFVNRDNLIWCRQKAGLTISDVYSKTKWSAETQKIEKWESGESFPSISDLKKLGKIYKRAWTLFLIDRKINQLGFSVMKDFRTLTSDIPEKNDKSKPEIIEFLNEIEKRQEFLKDFNSELDIKDNNSFGSLEAFSKASLFFGKSVA